MTCLVAWRGKEGTWMGADSAWTEGNQQGLTKDHKVWRSGRFLMSAAGCFRSLQILKYQLPLDSSVSDKGMVEWMVCEYLPEVLSKFDELGKVMHPDETDNTSAVQLEFLVASERKIWRVSAGLSCVESHTNFATGGSGGDFATGFLAGHHPLYDGRSMVLQALKIAHQHGAYVRPPFVIRKV
jgi:ATP-dependent protease HslVU (ClpYQ) peptidase subunit